MEITTNEVECHSGNSLPPGTVHLVDLEQRLEAKHASGREKDILLVPAPSTDPDDPLNWSPRRKLLSTITLNTYAAVIAMGTAVTYAIIVPMSKATELSVNDLNTGTGYLFLLGGWGSLIWQPLALQFGKRPVYLLSLLVTTAVMVWAPYTKTNGQWIANKIVQGFFSAPVNSLAEISVADVYFTHERGRYLALFTMFIIGGVYIWPILSGFINDGEGWQWVLFWMGIISSIAFVFCFLFMEETNYYSERSRSSDRTLSPSSSQAVRKKKETAVSAFPPRKGTKTFIQKLYLFDVEAFRRPNRLKGMVLRPLVFLSFPVISYAGFSWGSAVVWHAVFNATASLVLGNPPYDFRASMVGLSFVSGLIGVVLGSLYTGQFGDWFVIYKARRNAGLMEPEHRQWLFIASVVLLPASLILWVRLFLRNCAGLFTVTSVVISRCCIFQRPCKPSIDQILQGVGAFHHIPWPGLVIGECLLSVTNTIGTQLSIAYAIDSYHALSGEAMVSVVLIRNTMVFAIGYGVTPWVLNMGFQNAFMVAAFVGMAQVLLFLVFVRWGKAMRERSAGRYKRYLEEMAQAGFVH